MIFLKRVFVIVFTLTLILFYDALYAQYQEDTVYIKFKENKGTQPKYRGKKYSNDKEKGIVFNLLDSGSLLYKLNQESDTLPLSSLKNYPITSIKEVEKKVKEFRWATYKKRPPKSDEKLYQAYTKNDIFKTYLIEIINDSQFVVYPVKWRNQKVKP